MFFKLLSWAPESYTYIIYITESISCSEGDIRLADGKIDQEGRIEVCSNGVWGTICDTHFDIADGHVVCSNLGYKKGKLHVQLFILV